MNIGKITRTIIPKAIGLGSLTLLTYDSFSNGVRKGNIQSRNEMSLRVTDVFINHQSARKASTVLEKVKDWYRQFWMDERMFTSLNRVKNLFISSGKQLASNAIPISLGIGALCLPGAPALICAGLLVAGGIHTVLRDVIGVGRLRQIK